MIKQKIFSFFYYTQIQLVMIAVSLSATTSSVLLGKISWESMGIVGMSTFITYSMDNLIDWEKDSKRYQNIIKFLPTYRILSYILIPLCIATIILFTLRSSEKFQIGLLLLGSLTISSIIRSPKILNAQSFIFRPIILNRLFISCIWAIVLVFIPITYTGSSIDRPQVWMTFAYLWHLTFISAVLWKFEKEEKEFSENNFPKPKIIKYLKLLSISTMTLAITDIVLGYFPLYNLVVLLPPLTSFITLHYWNSTKTNLRIVFSVHNLFQVFFSILATLVHLQ